jgi:tryptophan halogenase
MELNKSKNIIVLGGGTAGYFTALYLRKNFPNFSITLIESKEIGIIGVGEATTPNVIDFLYSININPIHLIKNINGTIKNGISFENWNGDNKKYFHGFLPKNQLNQFSLPPIFGYDCYTYYLKTLIKNKLNFNEYTYAAALSYKNKIDLNNLSYALHFDANALADYLRPISLERKIKIIDGKLKEIQVDNKDFITSVILEDNDKIDCDFIFDCTGFSKILIGKHFKQKWISYKKNLPINKAILFPREYKKNESIFPYTKSIALENGWMFQIPLQHRIGRGYLFDDNYINEEIAIKEVEKLLNEKIEVKKIIKFEAGRFENVWVKNCMAIGLSSSFIEPLESTSIFLTVAQLTTLNHFFDDLFNDNQKSKNLFNEIMGKNMDDTLGFVYLHYITNRNDSNFWKNFHKNEIPESFKENLNLIKENNLRFFNIKDGRQTAAFPLSSYLEVSNGIDIFKKDVNLDNYENLQPNLKNYKELIDIKIKNAIDHEIFLKKNI